jgi:hypothetical protein
MAHSSLSPRCGHSILAQTVLAVTLITGMPPERADAAGTLYWSSGYIRRASTEGDCHQTIVPQEINSSILDVDVDIEGGKVYFKHGINPSIRRCDLDGANIEVVYVAPPGEGPAVFDLDRINRKIYWTEDATERIMRSNFDGSGVEEVFSGDFPGPYGIAVHPEGGKVYWTHRRSSQGGGAIHRVNFDGSGHEQLVVEVQVPWGIAVHHASGKVFWIDGNGGSEPGGVYRANLDFTDMEQIVSALPNLRGMDIDEAAGTLYFGKESLPGVFRCDLDGGELMALENLGGAYGIACVSEEFGFVCFGDTNQDLAVNIDDLFDVVGSWGPCDSCPADFNGDGMVDIDDLFYIISRWTI